MIIKVFGKRIGSGVWPVIMLEWHGVRFPSKYYSEILQKEMRLNPAWVTLVIRTGCLDSQTDIYFRWLRVDWNSEHIARWFGEMFEAPHGTCFEYKGWLGHHLSI